MDNKYSVNEDYLSLLCYHRNHRRPDLQYDPLTGATRGKSVEYSAKGWMNSNIFLTFIQHFDRHAGEESPVVLLIDSVSSHINMDVFTTARKKGIQIYRLVPYTIHLMQPLDEGVFCLLKKDWNTIRKNTRDNPGNPVTKTFAKKLADTKVEFYAPKKVKGSFKGAGIYPINRDAINNDKHLHQRLRTTPSPLTQSLPTPSHLHKQGPTEQNKPFVFIRRF